MTREPSTSDLFQEAYDTLRRMAAGALRGERRGHTLQPTALVNEAFLRLSNQGRPWNDRGHFLAIASRAMRQVLVEWARARSRRKRGGPDLVRVTLDDAVVAAGAPASLRAEEVLHFNDALERLTRFDERKATLLELRVFGGLTIAEAAGELEVSEATVNREWRAARVWMASFLREGHGPDLEGSPQG